MVIMSMQMDDLRPIFPSNRLHSTDVLMGQWLEMALNSKILHVTGLSTISILLMVIILIQFIIKIFRGQQKHY